MFKSRTRGFWQRKNLRLRFKKNGKIETTVKPRLIRVSSEGLADMEMYPKKTFRFNILNSDIDPKSELKPAPRLGHEVGCGLLEELYDGRRK